MFDIKVLGTGCKKCQELLERSKKAVAELGLDCSIEKIDDIQKIVDYGVMMTPALVIDGEVRVTGSVPSIDDIKKMLVKQENSEEEA